MNSHIKTLSLISGTLVFSGVIYSLQGCHKEQPIGDDPAWVKKNSNSNNSPQSASVPMAAPSASAPVEVTVAASPTPSKETRARAAKQGQQAYAGGEYTAARPPIEVIEGAKAKRVDFYREDVARAADVGSPPTPATTPALSGPSELIAEASALLNERLVLHLGLDSGNQPSNAAYEALDRVQRALELIKQQPEPTDPELKKQYVNTKRAALAVRAKALDMVASRFAPGRVDEAEMAYKEYLAVESDPVKVSVAESNLAALLYRSGQWEKARVAYQRVLNRNPRNTEALARLTGIMRAIAKNQESAGELTEAKKSTEAADAYSERLQEVEVDRAIKYGDTLLRDRTVDTTRAVEKPTVGDKAAVKPAGDAKRPEPKPARIRP